MGGNYQYKTFTTLEGLLEFIREQIRGANQAGLILFTGTIAQELPSEGKFVWSAYYSK